MTVASAESSTALEPGIDPQLVGYRLIDRAAQAQGWLVGGALLSLLGFSLPWFKHTEKATYWYSGWHLWRHSGDDWIVLIYLAYLALLVACFQLLNRNPAGAAVTVALVFTVVLGTLLVLSIYSGEARSNIWNIGLPVMFLGHVVMLTAALAGLIVQLVREIFLGE